MGSDGIAVAEAQAPDPDLSVLDGEVGAAGVEFGRILDEVRKASDALGGGRLEEVVVGLARFTLIFRAVDDEFFLVVALAPSGNLGKARFLMRRHLLGAARADLAPRSRLRSHGESLAAARRIRACHRMVEHGARRGAARSARPGRRRCCASTSGAAPGCRSATRSRSPRRSAPLSRRGRPGGAAGDGRSCGVARRGISPTASQRRRRRLPAGLDASYRLLSDAILAALRELGVEAERAASADAIAPAADFDCFAIPATDEICAGGRKLAGSAQRRAAGAVLQHGSIRLEPDPAVAAAAVGLGRGATSLLELGVATTPPGRTLTRPCPPRSGGSWAFVSKPFRSSPKQRRAAEHGRATAARSPRTSRRGHALRLKSSLLKPDTYRRGGAASAASRCASLLLGR